MIFRKTVLCVILCATFQSLVYAGDVSRYDDVFRKYSKRFFGAGFDWRVFKAQGLAESNLNPQARSWVGAMGIMQLMPSTYKEIQTQNPEFAEVNNPEWNIAAGIYYDRQLWTAWTKNKFAPHRWAFVLGSYNAGRGTIRKAQNQALKAQLDVDLWPSIEEVAPKVRNWRHEETLRYVQKIETYYAGLSGLEGFEQFLGE